MLLQLFSLADENAPAFLGYVQMPDGLVPDEILNETCDQIGIEAGLLIDQDPETGAYTLSRGNRFLYSLEEVRLDST